MRPHLGHYVFIQSQNRCLLTKEQNLHSQRVLSPSKSHRFLVRLLATSSKIDTLMWLEALLTWPAFAAHFQAMWENSPPFISHLVPSRLRESHENLACWHLHYKQKSLVSDRTLWPVLQTWPSLTSGYLKNTFIRGRRYAPKWGWLQVCCRPVKHSLLSCRGSG